MATIQSVTAAVVQGSAILFNTAASLDKVAHFADEAARQKAKLIVFPEAFIGGYPKGEDFGAKLGIRTPEGRDFYRRYAEGAIEERGPESERLGAIARASGAYLVVGVIERGGATLYCSSFTYAPDGSYLGKHRKLMPTALERIIWGFGDGSTLPVFDTPFGKIGSAICWENYMPLLRTSMYAKGVQLYCAPTVDDREAWFPSMRMIALEGRCFVLSACQHLTGPGGAPLIRGGSCIVGPLGQVLVEPAYDCERVAVAELDLAEITRGKYDLDVVGHYARPDVFRLQVNERVQQAVEVSASDFMDDD